MRKLFLSSSLLSLKSVSRYCLCFTLCTYIQVIFTTKCLAPCSKWSCWAKYALHRCGVVTGLLNVLHCRPIVVHNLSIIWIYHRTHQRRVRHANCCICATAATTWVRALRPWLARSMLSFNAVHSVHHFAHISIYLSGHYRGPLRSIKHCMAVLWLCLQWGPSHQVPL